MISAKINYVAVIVTGLVAFGLSGILYSVPFFVNIMKTYGGAVEIEIWKMFVAPLREMLVAAMLSYLIVRLDFNWNQALGLGLALWFVFFGTMLSGAVIFNNEPWQINALHLGDWLMKMSLMSVILAVWHGSGQHETTNGKG